MRHLRQGRKRLHLSEVAKSSDYGSALLIAEEHYGAVWYGVLISGPVLYFKLPLLKEILTRKDNLMLN
jgi:hypothetical protein